MKIRSARCRNGGFTIAEITVGMGVLTAVGVACYSMMLSSSILFAKNLSLNTSNTILRTALDRMYNDVSQAYGVPKLINADGSPATDKTAAGITFDLYLGGPYVVTNPSGTGLTASTQTLSMKYYAGDALSRQPLPATNDVVVLDNGPTRPVVNICAANPNPVPPLPNNITETLSIDLKSPLGNAVSWNSTTTKTAFLVHKKAYVVASGQLRLYNNAEAVSDYNDPVNYVVLSHELSGLPGENAPFSLVTPLPPQNANKFLNIAMRVQDQTFNKSLTVKQAKEFNTFLQLDTMLRPRN